MDAILKECEQMCAFLEITTSDDLVELSDRLVQLNVYLARSGRLLADAKQIQDRAVAGIFAQHSNEIAEMSPTIAKKFIESHTDVENRLVLMLERINRTCVHQSDNIRTLISLSKEQMKLTRTGY